MSFMRVIRSPRQRLAAARVVQDSDDLIVPNKGLAAPSGPPTYNGTLTVGVIFGTSYGFSFGSGGAVNPADWGVTQIGQILALGVTTIPVGSQIRANTFLGWYPDVTLLDMTIAGAPSNPYRLAVEGQSGYFMLAENPANLLAYLTAQAGNDLALTLEPVTQTFELQGTINVGVNGGKRGYERPINMGAGSPYATNMGLPTDPTAPRFDALYATTTQIIVELEQVNPAPAVPVQWNGANQITLNVEGAPLSSYVLTWNGTQYVRTNADANGLYTHLGTGADFYKFGFDAV